MLSKEDFLKAAHAAKYQSELEKACQDIPVLTAELQTPENTHGLVPLGVKKAEHAKLRCYKS